FFDTTNRNEVSLYTDASGIGLGGFYIQGSGLVVTNTIPISNAFAVPVMRSTHSTLDINILEMEAIEFALQTWGHLWTLSRVLIFTDNKTSELGLLKQTLRSLANTPLRSALLLAATHD